MKSATDFLSQLGVRPQYHKWVWLMLALLVLRFVGVPVWSWQQEKLDSIEFLTLQTRSPDEIAARKAEVEQTMEAAENSLRQLRAFYRVDSSLKEAELTMARQVESIAQSHGLVITSRSWTTEYEEKFFAKQQVRLEFEGYIDELQPFLIALESHREPVYMIEKLDINNRGGGSQVRARITVSQLMRIQEPDS